MRLKEIYAGWLLFPESIIRMVIRRLKQSQAGLSLGIGLIAALVANSSARAGEYDGLVFIGDSITAFWPTQPAFPGSQNVGIGGEVSERMWARFETDVLAKKPKVIVILAGTDDIRYYGWTDQYYLQQMVIEGERAGAAVIVGMLPANTGWDLRVMTAEQGQEKYQTWNLEVLSNAAAYGYQVVNYFSATVSSDGTQNPLMFEADGTHPNAVGYNGMTAVLQPVLAAALASTQPPSPIGGGGVAIGVGGGP